MEKLIAEFVGWHLGDGCISLLSKNRLQYTLTGDIKEEKEFYKNKIIPTFNQIFQEKFGKKITLKSYQSVGVCGVYLSDNRFINWLQKKYELPIGKKINAKIPSFIMKGDKEIKISFLRGLFDTDGSIFFCKSNAQTVKPSIRRVFHYKPKIKFAVISEGLVQQSLILIKSLGIHARIQKPAKQRKNENMIYSLVIDRVPEVIKWLKIIGFHNSKHQTKIKVWKKFGFCPPYTTLKERKLLVENKDSPLKYYNDHQFKLKEIINKLQSKKAFPCET